MRKLLCLIAACLIILIIYSCAPVLRYDLMQRGVHDKPPAEIMKNPAAHKSKLFILGGIIVNTATTKKGSLIEAVYVPVDSRGYLKPVQSSGGRYFALYSGFLDPLIYSEKRKITVAGFFAETRKGKISDMDYTYPLFMVEEIYLWEEKENYLAGPPPHWYYPYRRYPPWWYSPWRYDPWYDPWW